MKEELENKSQDASNLDNKEAFEEYRRQMHRSYTGRNEDGTPERPKRNALTVAFGLFMVLVYLGMGCLLFVNFFGAPDTPVWTFGRWFVGIVLVLYGIFRCWRMIAGVGTRY